MFGESADAHDGGGDGNLGGFGKLAQLFAGVAADHAAAAIKNRTLGFFDETDDLIEFKVVGMRLGIVAAEIDLFRKNRLRALLLDVLGDVDDDRAWSTGPSDVEGFLHDARNVVDVRDEVTVLDDGQGHAEEVGLLEAALAD